MAPTPGLASPLLRNTRGRVLATPGPASRGRYSKMPTPTVDHPTTRPALGLTGKGRAVVLLRQVERRWDGMSAAQRAECGAILDRLAAALRREALAPIA